MLGADIFGNRTAAEETRANGHGGGQMCLETGCTETVADIDADAQHIHLFAKAQDDPRIACMDGSRMSATRTARHRPAGDHRRFARRCHIEAEYRTELFPAERIVIADALQRRHQDACAGRDTKTRLLCDEFGSFADQPDVELALREQRLFQSVAFIRAADMAAIALEFLPEC